MPPRRVIDLGLDPRDPWAVIPTYRQIVLFSALAEFARIRRLAPATANEKGEEA